MSIVLRKIKSPLRGITGYENLRQVWLAKNPHATELQTLEACKQFAAVTGLLLREKLLQSQIAKLKGTEYGNR